MPKLLVLFHGADSPASTLAEAAAEGAAAVRFTEVDIRDGAEHQATTDRRHKRLDSAARLEEYDGVVLAVSSGGDVPMELDALIDALGEHRPFDAFANTVFAVVGGENATLIGRVERLGGIIVSEPRGIEDPQARARATGKRAATVTGWVRHALNHEQEHAKRDHAHAAHKH